MDGYSVDETHHSVPLVRVMAFDVEQITCGTLSSPSEGVSPTTSVFIDSVMHASCYACNSVLDACHSLSQHLSAFTEGFVRRPLLHAFEVAGTPKQAEG